MVEAISGRIPALDVLDETSPPDLDTILSLHADTESYFRGFHSECEKVDDYYFGRNDIATPMLLSMYLSVHPEAKQEQKNSRSFTTVYG